MGWALDATSIARDAAPGFASVRAPACDDRAASMRWRQLCGLVDGRREAPADAIDEARPLAREAPPERPLFVGATGR